MTEFIDLYCGAGLGARGALRGGGRPVLAVDAWDLATKTYKTNFPNATVISERIETVDPAAQLHGVRADVLLASPECTAHSIARGANKGCEKSRETALRIIPWIEVLKPRWVVIENVNRMKAWPRHEELVEEIENLGYTINQLLLNSHDFGSPQARKRLFMVCDLHGTALTAEDLKPRTVQLKSAKECINWSGEYPTTPLRTTKRKRAENTIKRAERAMQALGKGIPFLIVYYGSDYAGGWQSLDAPLRTVTTLDRFGLVTWKGRVPHLRMLQPAELLIAMGGDGHLLPHGSRRDKVKMVGNGVCSDVTEQIFRWISSISKNEQAKAA